MRLSDFLVADGAQVTRPSIDPYREEIEISTFFGGARLRLSSPFFFTHLPEGVPPEILYIFAKTSFAMGLLLDIGDSEGSSLAPYSERLISRADLKLESSVRWFRLDEYLATPSIEESLRALRAAGRITLLRLPTSKDAVGRLVEGLARLGALDGILLDEDDNQSGMPLETAVSLVDRQLKERGTRGKLSLLAEGNGVRGSDDVFKLLALGADCVGLGKAALIAVGVEEGDKEIVLDSRISQRLENLVVALWRDIKLLAGAAGVSNVASTLTGNRELLRSVDLDPSLRLELGVKPAGAA